MRVSVLRSLMASALALSAALFMAQTASAQQQPPPGQGMPAPLPPVEAPPPWPTTPQTAVVGAEPAVPGAQGGTDHDKVVGRWGIEARQVAVGQKTPGQDLECGADCPVSLNALSVRRWSSPAFAWGAGLVLGLGGGGRKVAAGTESWDTYLGVGPTLSASFLLTSWKHLAVSTSPQLDFVFFMPGGSRPKTFLISARGLIEGELHLGFIGLPELSLGIASGLVLEYRGVTSAALGSTANQWSVGFAGPQSLWGLITNMYVRFYF